MTCHCMGCPRGYRNCVCGAHCKCKCRDSSTIFRAPDEFGGHMPLVGQEIGAQPTVATESRGESPLHGAPSPPSITLPVHKTRNLPTSSLANLADANGYVFAQGLWDSDADAIVSALNAQQPVSSPAAPVSAEAGPKITTCEHAVDLRTARCWLCEKKWLEASTPSLTIEEREAALHHAQELRWCDLVGGMGMDRHLKVQAAELFLRRLSTAAKETRT